MNEINSEIKRYHIGAQQIYVKEFKYEETFDTYCNNNSCYYFFGWWLDISVFKEQRQSKYQNARKS